MNKGIYLVLTLANLSFLFWIGGKENLFEVAVFFTGMVLNHVFLVYGVRGMLAAQKRSALLVLKFFVLGGVFFYVSIAMRKYLIFCVLSYIFQLIILGLSIKRNDKKIKDSDI